RPFRRLHAGRRGRHRDHLRPAGPWPDAGRGRRAARLPAGRGRRADDRAGARHAEPADRRDLRDPRSPDPLSMTMSQTPASGTPVTPGEPVVSAEGLTVTLSLDGREVPIVTDVSFDVRKGE